MMKFDSLFTPRKPGKVPLNVSLNQNYFFYKYENSIDDVEVYEDNERVHI